MDLVFNELSAEDVDSVSTYEAENAMNMFFEVIVKVNRLVPQKSSLCYPERDSFNGIEIGKGYYFEQWLSRLDRVKRSLAISFFTGKPFLHHYPYYFYNDKEVKGFAYACEEDLLSISYNPQALWNNCYYKLSKESYLDEAQEKSIVEEPEVRHISSVEHIYGFETWIKTRARVSILNGQELWAKREELFPDLIFCDGVKKQVLSLNARNMGFNQIISTLRRLDDYCKAWSEGSFDMEKVGTKISPESDNRKRMFRDKLTFRLPDEREELFSYHARFTPGAGRIHFFPDSDIRKLYIGYIGDKIQ